MIKLKELLFLKKIKGFGKVKINNHLEMVKESEDLDQLIRIMTYETKLEETSLTKARSESEQKFDEITQQHDLKCITVFDPEYPQGLLDLKGKKPVILYAKGDISTLNKPGVSVVGTRAPSPWTQKFGHNISKQMGVNSGRIIVSGLALGCDRFAHEGALLANVPTIAVLPSGVNVITPPSHKTLAEKIIENGGCLISEYDPDATAFRTSFLERDTLIAAMTGITFVIECAEKSGTMHTVKAAWKMGRKLACYYPDQDALLKGAKESDYLGNKKMIETIGASIIANQADLKKYFDNISSNEGNAGSIKDEHQISITELYQEDTSNVSFLV